MIISFLDWVHTRARLSGNKCVSFLEQNVIVITVTKNKSGDCVTCTKLMNLVSYCGA